MKYLKRFNESAEINIDKIINDLHVIAPSMRVRNMFDSGTLTIDPDGTVNSHTVFVIFPPPDLKRLPAQFGKVEGSFYIENSKHHGRLTTLEGCPYECKGIRAVGQDITNLVGGPRIVGDHFNLESCKKLTSLDGAPEVVEHIFNIKDTAVTSLEGGPHTAEGYNCSKTRISNLIGVPETLRYLQADYCPNLTSLEGLPKWVNSISLLTQESYSKNIWDPRPLKDCEFERLAFSQGSPLYELLDCFNGSWGTYNLLNVGKFKQVCKNFKYSLDYNYIRGTRENPQINLFRFKEALEEFGITELRRYHSQSDPTTGYKWGGMQTCDRLIHYTFVDDSGRPVDFNGQAI